MRNLWLFIACIILGPLASAQSYPNKPLKLIVPYAVGQSSDIIARYFANALAKSLGQPIVVENIVGAGGNIGITAASRATPDGYTFTVGTVLLPLNPHLYVSPGFDPDAFVPFAIFGISPLVIAANQSYPLNTFAEVIEAAKRSPDTINIALPSTLTQIVHALISHEGVPLFGVPYKSSPSAAADVLGGQVPLLIDGLPSVQGLVDSGRLKILGVTSSKPTELLPNIKPVSQQGLPGFEGVGWVGFFALRGTPPEILRVLHREMTKVLAEPESKKLLLKLYIEPGPATSLEELSSFVAQEKIKWAQRVKAANIKPQ